MTVTIATITPGPLERTFGPSFKVNSPFNNAGTAPARASNARPGQEEVQLHLLYREQHQPGGKQNTVDP